MFCIISLDILPPAVFRNNPRTNLALKVVHNLRKRGRVNAIISWKQIETNTLKPMWKGANSTLPLTYKWFSNFSFCPAKIIILFHINFRDCFTKLLSYMLEILSCLRKDLSEHKNILQNKPREKLTLSLVFSTRQSVFAFFKILPSFITTYYF